MSHAVFTNDGALVRASPVTPALTFSFFFLLSFSFPIFFHTKFESYNKSIIAFLLGRVILSSQVMYCPSLRSGQYYHPRTEYSPVLPSQSCNNIYLLFALVMSMVHVQHGLFECDQPHPIISCYCLAAQESAGYTTVNRPVFNTRADLEFRKGEGGFYTNHTHFDLPHPPMHGNNVVQN